LAHVLGLIGAHRARCDPVDHVAVSLDEGLEGSDVARPRSFDQLAIRVHRRAITHPCPISTQHR
jgi:hypothetical protein